MSQGLAGSRGAEKPVPNPHACKGLHASVDTKASGAIPVLWSSEFQEEAGVLIPLELQSPLLPNACNKKFSR